MQEHESSRDRLEAAVEAKGLSSFPHLKRAILRSRFVAILFTVALVLLVVRTFEQAFAVDMIVVTAIEAALVFGLWGFSLRLIKSFHERQWEMLKRLLGVGAQIFLGLAILTGISAFASVIVLKQVLPALIPALVVVGLLVWRNDFVRAREDLAAMLAEREANAPSQTGEGRDDATRPEPVPLGPAQALRRKRWLVAGVVSIVVLAGAAWLVVEANRARNDAEEKAQEEQAIAKAERIDKIGVSTRNGHESDVNSVAFSPDGRTVASGSNDKTVRLWEVASGKTTAIFSGHESEVRSVAFSPNGRTVASGSKDSTVRLWDVSSGKTITTLRGHEMAVVNVAFSPDGRAVASASEDGAVRLWDATSGKTIATFSRHGLWVNGIAFSPDGLTLASGAVEDRNVRLWDIASGNHTTLSGQESNVHSVAFSPDGRSLAAGSFMTIRLWNVASGKAIFTFSGHRDAVKSIAFSPDGHTLASGSMDATVRLWDAGSGKSITTLSGHVGFVESVAFSPDGRTLASASTDKTVRLWPISGALSR